MEDSGLTYDLDTCHRLALDHVLGLIANAGWSDALVLRGSMLMTAYAGSGARKPADLDFVVIENAWPVDEEHPYPYVDDLSTIQQWPEVADGAGRAELWAEEEFDTAGRKPRVSPEGLQWVMGEDWEHASPYGDLKDLVAENKWAAAGLALDAGRMEDSGEWMYAHYDMPGVRLTIPWHTTLRTGPHLSGEVSLDFALDERMPEPPVWARIPRLAGGHTVVRAASPELSLAWKLVWLLRDTRDEGESRGKDLYDAVLLAERPGLVLDMALLRRVLADSEGLDVEDFTLGWRADVAIGWQPFAEREGVGGSAGHWMRRLATALKIAPTIA
jgi:hypothetical protein